MDKSVFDKINNAYGLGMTTRATDIPNIPQYPRNKIDDGKLLTFDDLFANDNELTVPKQETLGTKLLSMHRINLPFPLNENSTLGEKLLARSSQMVALPSSLNVAQPDIQGDEYNKLIEENPEEETFIRSYQKENRPIQTVKAVLENKNINKPSIGKSVVSGIYNVVGGLYGAGKMSLEGAYYLASLPQNLIAKTFNIDELATNKEKFYETFPIIKKALDVALPAQKTLEYAQGISSSRGFDKDMSGYLKDGDYKNFGKLLGYQVIENLPQQAIIWGTAIATGNPLIGTAIISGQAAGGKYETINKDVPEYARFTNALSTGMTEYLTESYLGTVPILKSLMGKSKELLKAGVKEAVKDYAKNTGKAFVEEGFEETVAQFSENLIDILSNNRDEYGNLPRLDRNVADATFVGSVTGGLLGAGGTATQRISNRDYLKAQKETIKEVSQETGVPEEEVRKVVLESEVTPEAQPEYKLGNADLTRKQAMAIINSAENVNDIEGLKVNNDAELESMLADKYNSIAQPQMATVSEAETVKAEQPVVETAQQIESPDIHNMSLADFTGKYIEDNPADVENLSETELADKIVGEYQKYAETAIKPQEIEKISQKVEQIVPETEQPAQKETAKEPWQMTRIEYQREMLKPVPVDQLRNREDVTWKAYADHKKSVNQAIAEGKYDKAIAEGAMTKERVDAILKDHSEEQSRTAKSAEQPSVETVKPSSEMARAVETPDAKYIGMQKRADGTEIPLFNIIKEGHPRQGGTVSAKTLTELGLQVPEITKRKLNKPKVQNDRTTRGQQISGKKRIGQEPIEAKPELQTSIETPENGGVVQKAQGKRLKINEWQDIKDLDAQIRTIEKPKKEGDDWTVEIGLQESLGEQGGDILTKFYKDRPTIDQIRQDILERYQYTKAEINKESAMGVVAKSGRDEMIEKAIDNVLGKQSKISERPRMLRKPIVYYHGSNKKLTKDDLNYGTFLTTSEQEATDYANMRSDNKGGKPIISKFILNPEDVRYNAGTNEYQYIGKSKSIIGGKYPESIYRAFNDVEGGNYTKKEIDAIPYDEVRATASMGFSNGRDEFDKLMGKTPEKPRMLRKPVQTQTPEFKKWFGNSKVVDKDGKPLVVYHGTPDPSFTKFKYYGGLTGELGYWFASKGEAASEFAKPRYAGVGPAVYPVYLSIKNPMVYHGWGELVDHINKLRKGKAIEVGAKSLRRSLLNKGYDGIVLRDSETDFAGLRDDFVAFYPTQIKSAIGNRGTFSTENPDIRYLRKPSKAEYDINNLPKEILDKMNRSLKSAGFEVRGSEDVQELINRGRVYREGRFTVQAWQDAYDNAIGSKQKRLNKIAENQKYENINWQRIRELGHTVNIKEAGYIQPNGSLIDLSGKREGGTPNERSLDHREAGGTIGMQELGALGYIRIDYNSGSLDIVKEPTPEQYKVIKRFADDNKGYVVLDLWDGLGNKSDNYEYYSEPNRTFNHEYSEDTRGERIVNDIKKFFAGETPIRPLFKKKKQTKPTKRLIKLSPEARKSYNEWKSAIESESESISGMLGAIQAEAGNKPIKIDTSARAYDTIRQANDIYTKLFHGKNIVVLDTPADINGVQYKDRIFVSNTSSDAIPVVFAHELMHEIKKNNPDLYDNLKNLYRDELKTDIQTIRDTYKAMNIDMENLTDEEILDEALNSFVGEKLSDNGFWDKLNTKSPSLAKRMLDAIKEIVRKITDYFKGKEQSINDFVNNADSVVKMAENVISEYMGEKQRAIESKPEFMTAPVADTFYMQSLKVVQDKFPDKMATKSITNWLRNNQVKPEELEWLDIDSLTKNRFSITKQELIDYIRAKIRVAHGDEITETYFGTLGEQNYMTVPSIEITPAMRESAVRTGQPMFSKKSLEDQKAEIKRIITSGVFAKDDVLKGLANAYANKAEKTDNPDEFNKWYGRIVNLEKLAQNKNPNNPTEGLEIPEETKWQYLQRKLQDRLNRLKYIQNLGNVNESTDAYMAAELYPGKAEDRIDRLVRKPIIDDKESFFVRLTKDGYNIQQLGEYMYAKHAIERNKHIQAINKNFTEGGSGLTDAEASDILNKYKNTDIDKWAKEFRNLVIEPALKLRFDDGLITQESYDTISKYYENYVPLKGSATEKTYQPTGKGFSVIGKDIRRAKGRNSLADNPVIQSIIDYESAIIRAEKNKVAQTFLKFVEENPSPKWRVESLQYMPQFNKDGEIDYLNPLYKTADNVLEVKQNGKTKYVIINDEALVSGLKNLGVNNGLKFVYKLNQYMRGVATIWNPEFMITNFERDIQTAMVHIVGEKNAKIARKVIKDVPGAIRGIYSYNRGKTGEWQNWFNDFKQNGGKVGWASIDQDVSNKTDQIEKKIRQYNKSGKIKDTLRSLGNFITLYNESIENGVRLATYKNLVDSGISKAKAAQYAKNVTVNFNKKGEAGSIINSIWLFSNASIQGTARIMGAVVHSPRVRKIVAGLVIAGFVQSYINRLVNPDDWDKYDDYNKDNYWLFLLPNGKTIAIKLPYGYNIFKVMGGIAEEMVFGNLTPSNAAIRLFKSIVEAFSPITGGSFSQVVSPSFLDPIIQIAENKNFFGAPIMPEQPQFSPKKPNSKLYFKSVRPLTKAITEKANEITGGGENTSGIVDISPEVIDHFIDSIIGGTGKFITRFITSGKKLIKWDKPVLNEIPIIRQIIKEPSEWKDVTVLRDMYENISRERFSEREKTIYLKSLESAYENENISGEQYGKYLSAFNKYQGKTLNRRVGEPIQSVKEQMIPRKLNKPRGR